MLQKASRAVAWMFLLLVLYMGVAFISVAATPHLRHQAMAAFLPLILIAMSFVAIAGTGPHVSWSRLFPAVFFAASAFVVSFLVPACYLAAFTSTFFGWVPDPTCLP